MIGLLPRFTGPKPNYTPDRTEFTYRGVLTDVPFPGTGGALGGDDAKRLTAGESGFLLLIQFCDQPEQQCEFFRFERRRPNLEA